jgi:hypothetical protein
MLFRSNDILHRSNAIIRDFILGIHFATRSQVKRGTLPCLDVIAFHSNGVLGSEKFPQL